MAPDSAQGGEGGLKPEPGRSPLDSVAARVDFQQQKAEELRNCSCPFGHPLPAPALRTLPGHWDIPSGVSHTSIRPCSSCAWLLVFPTTPIPFQSQCCGMNGVPSAPRGSGPPSSLCCEWEGSPAHGHAQLSGGCRTQPGSQGISFFHRWNFALSMGLLPSRCRRHPGPLQAAQAASPRHGNAAGISAFPDLSRSPSLTFVRERMD